MAQRLIEDSLLALRRAHPWPERSDWAVIPPWPYALGGGGRELVDAIIRVSRPRLMVEIGVFLGASTKRWLDISPRLTVIGIDPWDELRLIPQCRRYVGRPALTRAYPDPEMQERFAVDIAANGVRLTALSLLRPYRDRFIPMQATSPDGLHEIAATGLKPDLVYIDADKKAEDLEAAHRLWPEAIIAGDDWHWGRTKGYPMRRVVEEFAAKNGFAITADHGTWVLTRQGLTA